MSDLDPVCIHNVVRSICPWKDCNPNFAEEPDYRNLPKDIRGDGDGHMCMSAGEGAAAFALRWPELLGTVSTHYEGCYKHHPPCAWRMGYDDATRGTNA